MKSRTGTSRLTGILVETTEIPVKRNKFWSKMKFKLTSSEKVNLQKRKQKETTFVVMLFMRRKLVFVLLTNYYQLFHAFLNEIDTSRSPGTSRDGVPRSYKPKMKYISGNRDKRSIVLVHWNVPFVLAYSCKVSVKSTHYIISVDIPPLRN